MDYDLKLIKKKYGENMAKLCREFFPTILEKEGLLSTLMLNRFEPNHSLYQDLIDQEKEIGFKNYIYSLISAENNKVRTNKTPKELLNEAGYDLYECETEEEVQKFRKYYTKEEELCTFRDKRLNSSIVFFAVKKDVDEIKREDYQAPKRQDRYGTSVISIQFTNDPSHTLSIKNRYNHTVNNPDSTFSNNLDNIIEGLTESFEREYGLIQQHKNDNFEINGYVRANDGKYYKYNNEINNIYYCPNNIIIDNFEVKRYEKEKYIIMDYFILDLVNKKIKLYNEIHDDAFLDTIKDIEKIEIEKKLEEKQLTIKVNNGEDIKLVLNKNNEIIKLINPNVQRIGNQFLHYNTSCKEIDLPNLQKVGYFFLCYNSSLEKVNLPNLRMVELGFLCFNTSLEEISLPNLKIAKSGFLEEAPLKRVNLPNLCEVGNNFLKNNKCIKELSLPNLQKIESYFLERNNVIEKLTLPKVQEIGDNFLYANKNLKEINLPNVQKVGNEFLYTNDNLRKLDLQNLKEVGYKFLYYNSTLEELNCPNLNRNKIRFDFLEHHPIFNEENFKDINMGKVKQKSI